MSLRWYGDVVIAGLERAVMKGVIKGTEAVRERMIERVMQPPKTGQIYPRGEGRYHRASAPGESPANDTGNLVRNITTSYDVARLAGTVTARTEYAAWLEYGTLRMDARPFARPALAEKTAAFRDFIADEIRKDLNK